jgi:putative PIN family toxin of toxin-antitoxin system
MPARKTRFIFDTNLWISFLIHRDFRQIDEILLSDDYELVFSMELLEEFLDVIRRPKFHKYFSTEQVESALEIVIDSSRFVEVNSTINFYCDPKDNFLLALASDSDADYLVTGDHDLLTIGKINRTEIVTLTDFLKNNRTSD